MGAVLTLNMNGTSSTNWFTGPNARKVLRLYLAWPKRFGADPETEAEAFYRWLKQNYGEMTVVNAIRKPRDIEAFLTSNPEVIEAAKFLKPGTTKTGTQIRRKKRVRISTQAFLGVYECEPDPSLIGHAIKGNAFDVTPDGLGVETEEPLPVSAILNITVAPAGYPLVLYRMTGEVRWVSDDVGPYQLGLKLFGVDDADRWQADFDKRFQTSALYG